MDELMLGPLVDPVRIHAPSSMAADIGDVLGGCYDAPDMNFGRPPRILDIGACVGAFSVWASRRWPGAQITCYEPNPEAFAYLEKNAPTATLHRAAVGLTMGRRLLRHGKHNLGEASLCDIGGQIETGVKVPVVAAHDLGPFDLVKVDTEGSELPILASYFAGQVGRLPLVIALEYHRQEDRRALDDLLVGLGYVLFRGRIDRPWLGTLVYTQPYAERPA